METVFVFVRKLSAVWPPVVCLTFAGQALGQAVPEKRLSPVVVTASKTELTEAEAPASVTVIDREQIDNRHVQRVGDALSGTAGLFLRGNVLSEGNPTGHTGDLTLRGVPMMKRTLVMNDGVPLNLGVSGNVLWGSLFMDDVDRIEVVPGPFSALWGGYAMGGVVNVLSKPPEKREFVVHGEIGRGAIGVKRGSLLYRDKFANGWALSLGVNAGSTEGFRDDFVIKTPSAGAGSTTVTGIRPSHDRTGAATYRLGEKGAQSWNDRTVNLKVYYQLDPMTRFFAGVMSNRTKSDQDGHFKSYLRDGGGNTVTSGTNFDLGNGQKISSLYEGNFGRTDNYVQDVERYVAGGEHRFGAKGQYTLRADVSHSKLKSSYTLPGSGSATTYEDGPGSRLKYPKDNRTDAKVELELPVSNQMLTFGLSTSWTKMSREQWNLSDWRSPSSKTTMIDEGDGESRTVALYAQDEIAVSDELSVFLGARFEHWKTSGKARTVALNRDYGERSETNFSPKLALVYRASQALTLKASAGTAFRPPTVLELYAPTQHNLAGGAIGVTEGDPNLKPEKSRSYEISAEYRPREKALLRASLFHTTIDDLIYSKAVIPGNVLNLRTNAGKARIKGIEAAVEYPLNRWFTAGANLAYNDTEMLKNEAEPLSVGKRLTNVPRWVGNVRLDARYGPWAGSLDYHYSGKMYYDSQNRDVRSGVYGSYDKVGLANFRVGYDIDRVWNVSLSVHNLFDKHYYQYYLMPERTVYFGFTGKFF
ncbi:MAG: TonB-dependent receptor [Candidatus Accumulibacter sp.]|nr:TonB-dependent receptor [Accumulibacter sp.]